MKKNLVSDRDSSGFGARQKKTQEQIVADLERKTADAQRLASIGEARLNKWHRQTFF